MFNFVLLLIFSSDKKKILAVKRANIDPVFGGMWAPPGGQIENGEDVELAAKRELREETGLDLREMMSEDFLSLTPTLKGVQINLVVRLATIVPGEFSPQDKETEQVAWISLKQLLQSFAQFDLPVADIERFKSKISTST